MENKVLFRASAIGNLMVDSRSKNEVLSKTAKTYIEKVFKEKEFGYYENISNKYITKGLQNEDEAIELAAEVLNWDFILKNETRFKNDFVVGEPDILSDTLLADIKCSWNLDTFPMFENELPNKMYYWQLQTYMFLTGHRTSELVYCLTNTPQLVVEDEVRREHWKLNLIDEDVLVRQAIEQKHNFDHIPNELRVKRFIVEYNEADIEKLKQRIEVAREYYQELLLILNK
jgi:hypothetical protein